MFLLETHYELEFKIRNKSRINNQFFFLRYYIKFVETYVFLVFVLFAIHDVFYYYFVRHLYSSLSILRLAIVISIILFVLYEVKF